MRYFHRTSLPIPEALGAAETILGARLAMVPADGATRRFTGLGGALTVTVRADGGHYTLITATTDQVGESELDKVAKRFLAEVHARVDRGHAVRGAY